MSEIHIQAKTMNPGTSQEFVRLFATCPDGHDLGSIPLDMATSHPWDIQECQHYAHKQVAA